MDERLFHALPPPGEPPPDELWRPAGWGRPAAAGSPAGGEARVAAFQRSLDQELVALLRGVSLECPVCGEFVMHVAAAIACPECGLELRDEQAEPVGAPGLGPRLRPVAG